MTTIAILYGSQTGTAKDIAERMTRQAIQLGLDVRPSSMDDYRIATKTEIAEQFVIFVTSTTGQGEEPDNMKSFWKFLCKKSCGPVFAGVKYAVLGLGDSSYAKYNFVAKKLYKRVAQLGGVSLVDVALADDQHDLGVDAVAPGWISTVWQAILGDKFVSVPSGIISPKYLLHEIQENGHSDTVTLQPEDCPMRINKVISNTRMTAADHFQDVRYIEISAENMTYSPGDVVCIVPANSNEDVDTFFKIFTGIQPSQTILIEPRYDWTKPPAYLQMLTQRRTWHSYAKHYLDIHSVPSKSFFEYLNHFADDETEKWKLEEFCSPEGQDDFYKYCFKPRRTILEVLQDFPKTAQKIPIEYIFDLIPGIKSRSFSIASYKPNVIGVLVAVVEYQTAIKKKRKGLCSNWLAGLEIGDSVPSWVEKGSFTFPKPEDNRDVIMIGPGTGCAPFNSYINEQLYFKGTNQMYLFFGCRNASKDYFFEKEWTRATETGKLQIFIAHSRDSDYKFKYVQHQIQDNAALIFHLVVQRNAIIYIAGNSKDMPLDVQKAIISSLEQHGLPEADAYVKSLMRTGRYQTEVWR